VEVDPDDLDRWAHAVREATRSLSDPGDHEPYELEQAIHDALESLSGLGGEMEVYAGGGLTLWSPSK
jgi:hypothetical protein